MYKKIIFLASNTLLLFFRDVDLKDESFSRRSRLNSFQNQERLPLELFFLAPSALCPLFDRAPCTLSPSAVASAAYQLAGHLALQLLDLM